MSKILQFVYFLCYGLAAVAIAVMAPRIFPGTPHSVAWLAGTVVFLSGALMHEIASRCYHASLDRRRLVLLHRAYQDATSELERLAMELRVLKEHAADADAFALTRAGEEVPRAPVVERALPAAPKSERLAERPAPVIDDLAVEAGGTASERTLLQSLVQRLYSVPGASGGRSAGGRTAVVSGSLIEREILNAVRDGLRHSHLQLFVQPVVTLPQRKQRHYDCALSIASDRGDILPPGQYEPIVRDSGLTLAVDATVLFRTVQLLAKIETVEPGSYYFCRLPPACLSDRAFFGDFLGYLEDTDDLISYMAFAFREEDLIDLDDAAANVIGSLVDLGFHLCIEGLRNFDVDASQLAESGVRFVKIDAGMLMPAITGEAEAVRLRRLKAGLDAAGIDLIVANVANEQLLVELLDFDIEFGQGPLFGEARKIRGASVPPAEPRRERM